MKTPATNLVVPTDLPTERLVYEGFVCNSTAPEYREILAPLYAHWHHLNATFFGGALAAPHIGIGPTHARRFAETRLTNDYGGTMAICISERIAFPENTRIVCNPLPSTGATWFVEDLVTGETVKQYVMEVLGETEQIYGGKGPLFAKEAARIGPMIGLPAGEIQYRRRGTSGRGDPVAAFWPWAFRDEGYYLGDVRFSHLKVGGVRASAPRNQQVAPGVCDYLLFLAQTNRITRLIDVLGRQKDAETITRHPAVAAFERSPHDASGMPLPIPTIEPSWLYWNDGCVRKMAEGILARRLFDGMPILADALQDAGCEDPVLLGHCRENCTHTANCWALALLSKPI